VSLKYFSFKILFNLEDVKHKQLLREKKVINQNISNKLQTVNMTRLVHTESTNKALFQWESTNKALFQCSESIFHERALVNWSGGWMWM